MILFCLFHKVLGAGNVMWGPANQWFEDFGKFLGHTIGNRPTTRHYRALEECLVCGSCEGHRT